MEILEVSCVVCALTSLVCMIFCFAAKRKKLYQEPSKVIFKINDKGLLSMQHPDSNQSNEIKFKDEADNIKDMGKL